MVSFGNILQKRFNITDVTTHRHNQSNMYTSKYKEKDTYGNHDISYILQVEIAGCLFMKKTTNEKITLFLFENTDMYVE